MIPFAKKWALVWIPVFAIVLAVGATQNTTPKLMEGRSPALVTTTVGKVHVAVGDAVTKGQELLTLDTESFTQQKNDVRLAKAQALARFETAKLDFELAEMEARAEIEGEAQMRIAEAETTLNMAGAEHDAWVERFAILEKGQTQESSTASKNEIIDARTQLTRAALARKLAQTRLDSIQKYTNAAESKRRLVAVEKARAVMESAQAEFQIVVEQENALSRALKSLKFVAPCNGTVRSIVAEGAQVAPGTVIVAVEPKDGE